MRTSLLSASYATIGEHIIIRPATQLDYVILDTEDLSLCRQPARLVYAWLVQDERNGPLWSLRPVYGGCMRRWQVAESFDATLIVWVV